MPYEQHRGDGWPRVSHSELVGEKAICGDLLRSMGVEEVLAVEVGLKFDAREWNHGTVSPAHIQSGSLRIFDAPDGQEELGRSPGIATANLEAGDTASSQHRYWQLIDLETISHKIT